MSRVLVRPHSLSVPALEATAATLLELDPAGGHVAARSADGNLAITADGRMIVESVDPGFLIFACNLQGYAAAVEVAP